MLPAGLLSSIVVASSASAHVTLENREANIGAPYKAIFAVPHGCAGSATVKIRVQIPDGVVAAKPMTKAGWNLEVVKGKFAGEYAFHGAKVSAPPQ